MDNKHNYTQDISEIRSMMERSSRFLSLSGGAGVMAGLYALTGAYVAYSFFGFNPELLDYSDALLPDINKVIVLALSILVLAIATAIILSSRKARSRGEKVWTSTSKHFVVNMTVPLLAGGMLMLILLSKGMIGLLAPLSLLFYGLTLFMASKFTYDVVKSLGLIQIVLGLFSAWFIEYGLLCWALGFGVAHIVYGLYIHFRYER